LFKPNNDKITKDVIFNSNSNDGEHFYRCLEAAIENGDLNELRNIFDYIKSRRIRIKDSLSNDERKVINDFIDSLRSSSVFILKQGSIENYLPNFLGKKNLDALIDFLESETFLDELHVDYRSELIDIVNHTIK
jgi:hypothetical protein